MTTADEVFRTERLEKSFGPLQVLKGIDLTVRRGDAIVVLGASGSGKSTFLRCVNLLEKPTGGRLYLDGALIGRERPGTGQVAYRERELTRVRARIGMVFQQFNLFPHLTVERNVMIGPMKVLGVGLKEARDRARRTLETVGIGAKALDYPSRLSGGQQQRVAIARSLAMDPDIMLFDEATSALDPELVGEVLVTMRKLAEAGMTMLIVTHELGFAYHVATRVVFLQGGEIYEQGTPHEVLIAPQRERTQDFLRGHTLFRLPEQRGAM